MKISQRAQSLRPSTTLAVNSRAKELRDQGVDVLSFAAGEPDFDTPERIKQAAHDALNAGMTKYCPAAGIPEARQAIAHKLLRENKIEKLTPEHVVISAGGKHSLYLLFQALFDAPPSAGGPAEALLPTPAWVSYAPQLTLAGARVVEMPTLPESEFKITPEQLDAAITERSRILLLNSPSNPCGTMYTPEELRALADVVARRAKSTCPDLLVVSDELYEHIVYAGIPHCSPASIPTIGERTVTVNGLSKAYAMTGWRIGYLAAPATDFGLLLARTVAKLQTQMNSHITSFLMPAIRVALEEVDDEVERFRAAFARRAQLISSRLTEIPGMRFPKPTGAFYVFPDVSAHFGKKAPDGRVLNSALDFAEALLDSHHVAVVPGEDFLGPGHNCVRLSFACSDEQIEKGMERLGDFVSKLK